MQFEEMPKNELSEDVIQEYIEEINDADDLKIGVSILMGMEERYTGEVSRRLEEENPELWSKLGPAYEAVIEEDIKNGSREQ